VILGWRRRPFLSGKSYLKPGEYIRLTIIKNIENIFMERGIRPTSIWSLRISRKALNQ